MNLIKLLAYISVTINVGHDRFIFRVLPKGNCSYCTPIDPAQDIVFLLYTRRNPDLPFQLKLNDDDLLSLSPFDHEHPTVFYIHGFTEFGLGLGCNTIKEAYLKKGWYNVVVVDWSALCAGPWYSTAVGNSQVCGDYLALFLDYLIDSGMPLSTLHIIGFSLGAEVAGFTGRAITSGKLPRITGLDPAYPEYGRRNPLGRLNTLDAGFLDVIHTDSGQLGFPNPIGHIDFFPNGGRRMQPGCDMLTLLKRGVYEEMFACGHMRAWKYYAESVNNEMGFPAVQCKNWLHYKSGKCIASRGNTDFMGFAASKRSRGKYYLATNSQPPFATEDRLRSTLATNSQPSFATEDRLRRTLATNIRPSLAMEDRLRRTLETNSQPPFATEDRLRSTLATNIRPSLAVEDRLRRTLASNIRPSLAMENRLRRALATSIRPPLAKKGRLRRALYRGRTSTRMYPESWFG